MTDLEQLLVRRLFDRADGVPVGPAPIGRMVRAAVVRRRRPYVALAATAAAALVAVALAVVAPGQAPEGGPPVAPSPSVVESGSPRPVLSGARVGGVLSVQVPSAMTAAGSGCGGVPGDVVIAARGFVECRVLWEPGVLAVRLGESVPDAHGGVEIDLDGVPALRTPTRCEQRAGLRRCAALLWLASDETGIEVAAADDPAVVDRVLATAAVDEGMVSVPGPVGFSGVGYTLGHFRREAAGLGLRVRIPPGSAGRAWDFERTIASPAPGTVVPPGTLVRVDPGS